jgi:hypothetical protein
MKLKIGKNEIAVKRGDIITYDGEKYTLLSGDIRPLLVLENEHLCFVNLPKTTFGKIPKSALRKKRKTTAIQEWEFK